MKVAGGARSASGPETSFAVNFRPARRRPCASVAVAFGLLLAAPPVFAAGDFEIVTATADKVWRLNKRTGEISICSLEGTQLVCTPAKESAAGAVLVKRKRVYYGAWRPFIVVKPMHGAKPRKWK